VVKPDEYTDIDDLEDLDEDLDVEDLEVEDLDDEDLDEGLSDDLDEDLEVDGLGEEEDGGEEESAEFEDEDEDEEDEEDEDEGAELEDEEEDEEEEEALDILLARDTGLSEDLARLDDEARDGLGSSDAPISAGEFTCRSCFLVKRRPQLADEERMVCLDCV